MWNADYLLTWESATGCQQFHIIPLGSSVYTVSLSEELRRRDDVMTQQSIQVLDSRWFLRRELWRKVTTKVETLERRTGTCDDVKHVSVKRELKEDWLKCWKLCGGANNNWDAAQCSADKIWRLRGCIDLTCNTDTRGKWRYEMKWEIKSCSLSLEGRRLWRRTKTCSG